MGTHIIEPILVAEVKTTIDISDPLLREAKRLAAREGVTLKALIERGLHRVVSETKPTSAFKLRRGSFKGKGLRPELRDASWDRIRDLIYDEHGD
jgi:hypothetical protein